VVGADGRQAAGSDRGGTPPLQFDAPARLRVIDVRGKLFLAGAHLQRERALRSFREHLVGVETQADLRSEVEPIEAKNVGRIQGWRTTSNALESVLAAS